MSNRIRKYATVKHPTIEALVGGHYRYKELAQAQARLHSIAAHFVLSKQQPESDGDSPVVLMWIKGFGLTEADAQAGFTGQFAKLCVAQLPGGIYTLTATRVDKPLGEHPQKKRVNAKHPNWGHPIMRAVKKGKTYPAIEEAQAELDQLHLEFPEVSIPGPGKLYLIVYEKREGVARPTHKIALEIQVRPEGGFTITSRDNEKPAKPKFKQPPSVVAGTEAADASKTSSSNGYFASKVLLSKKKRRKNTGRPKTGMKPKEE